MANLKNRQRKHLEDAAKQSLDVFAKISGNARALLRSTGGASLNALASANAFTMEETARVLGDINRDQQQACERLVREPSIARVIAKDEDGNRETFYISRAAAPAPFLKGVSFASYRSPIGRLAALAPGDSLELYRAKGDVVLEVIERALFHPEELPEGWDSRDTLFQTEVFGPVTVDSLRRLFEDAADAGEVEDAFAALLREEEEQHGVVDKRRKALLRKMGLRDQPVLDKFQDKIFRMPINSRAILLGPPGSGKTTTLIKRLGQKLDLDVIRDSEPSEYALIGRMSDGGVEGVAPALGTGLHNEAELVRWLAARILEIESAVSPMPLPTIAILVNSAESGKTLAEALNRELEARSLSAVDCTDGRTISQSNEVGIFDVNDIKGLEFEAVFFLAIDRLAELHELYARFLYVGATRAATYLGISCEGELPPDLRDLEASFVERWSN